jgi:hypothetical protein
VIFIHIPKNRLHEYAFFEFFWSSKLQCNSFWTKWIHSYLLDDLFFLSFFCLHWLFLNQRHFFTTHIYPGITLFSPTNRNCLISIFNKTSSFTWNTWLILELQRILTWQIRRTFLIRYLYTRWIYLLCWRPFSIIIRLSLVLINTYRGSHLICAVKCFFSTSFFSGLFTCYWSFKLSVC